MYAVIRTGGKQYRVAPDDTLQIEKIEGEAGDTVSFCEVLLIGGNGEASIGTPTIEGAQVSAEVLEQGRGPKITIFKKKRRQNYRRKRGHRQDLTTVRILQVLAAGEKPARATKAKPTVSDAAPAADMAPAKKARKSQTAQDDVTAAPEGAPAKAAKSRKVESTENGASTETETKKPRARKPKADATE